MARKRKVPAPLTETERDARLSALAQSSAEHAEARAERLAERLAERGLRRRLPVEEG